MKVKLADGDFYIIGMEAETVESGQVSVGAAVIFDGAFGWHNTYRLVDLAEEHGMLLSDRERDAVMRYRRDRGAAVDGDFETVHDLAGKAEDFLNDQVTTEGWSFGWSDQDFLLANEAWWKHDV
jgi:hypothetical protein